MNWSELNTGDYEGMIAETVMIPRADGKVTRAYWSRPLGGDKVPGIVLIHHMPGWDEFNREFARRFTQRGYSVLCPNLYEAFGHGTPTEVVQRAREAGGFTDESVMADTEACLGFLHNQVNSNGKVGVIGMCSGGRHTFLAACTLDGIDAAVDCWGGGVTEEEARPGQVAPIVYAENLQCPLLGIFGNDDQHPAPVHVDKLEARLKELGKDYEFYRYDGAGHGFWNYSVDIYRQAQAIDSWNKTFAFFDDKLKDK